MDLTLNRTVDIHGSRGGIVGSRICNIEDLPLAQSNPRPLLRQPQHRPRAQQIHLDSALLCLSRKILFVKTHAFLHYLKDLRSSYLH